MRFLDLATFLVVCLVSFALTACTPVRPWEKGNLARRSMQLDPDAGEASFRRHVYSSREAASGGYGVSLGGCGCK